MLFQPYHSRLTAGQIRDYLKDYPDHAPVRLDGGDDWSDGHTLYATKPKELYMPSQDSLSRRLGAAFADVAAGAVHVPSPSQLRALAHPDQNRPVSVHLTSTRPAHEEVCLTPEQALKFYGVPSAAYKPTPGGYPSAGARA